MRILLISHSLTFLFLLGIGFVSMAAAEPSELSLTIEQAVEMALTNSRQLQSLDTNVEIQSGRYSSAGWIDNPEMRLRNISTRNINEDFDELELGVRWRPPGLGELSEDKQKAKVGLWERKVDVSRERHWLASRVRRACADVVMYRQLLTIAEDRLKNETKRISQIETMMNLGHRSVVYFTKSKMTVANARNEYTRILQTLKEEERRLARLTGVTGEIQIIPEPIPTIDLELARLLSVANDRRPEFRLVEERKRLAVKQYNLERLELVPWFSYLEASHHFESNTDDWQEFRLGVNIPLFNWNIGNIKATKRAITRKDIQSQAMLERVESEVRDRLAIYNDALLDWQLSKKDGDRMIQDATAVINDATIHGTVPADEILELERTIMDTKAIQIQKHRVLQHALYDLYYVLGIDNPEELTGIVSNGS